METQMLNQDGVVIDEICEDNVRLQIQRHGAEMVSLAVRDGDGWRGFLHRDGLFLAPDTGWANHATVMGYFLHRLWQERSTYNGHAIHGGNHGFLRHFDFPAPEILPDGLKYSVAGDAIPPEAYPFRVGCDISYRIVRGQVLVGFAFHNEEDFACCVSFGLHPGFAVSDVNKARLVFPQGTYTRLLAPGNFLNGESEVLHFEGGDMPYPIADLPGSFLLDLSQVPNKVFRLQDEGLGRVIRFDFSEVPYLTIWSDAADFLCVEPCWGMPDQNPPLPFEKKLGIQHVPARSTLRRKFGLTCT